MGAKASFLFLIPHLLCLACSAPPTRSPPAAPGRGTTSAPRLPEKVVIDIVEWAAGSGNRGNRPDPATWELLLVPPGGPLSEGEKVIPTCVEATSFLPAPKPDERLFFLIKSQLHMSPRRNQDPKQIPGVDPSLRLNRLLAFAAESSPLELLVLATPHGATAQELWVLTVGDNALEEAEPADMRPAWKDAGAFFSAFQAPRCLPGGRRCLLLSADDFATYLDEEPVRGATPKTLQNLGEVIARDASWASADGSLAFVLAGCGALGSL